MIWRFLTLLVWMASALFCVMLGAATFGFFYYRNKTIVGDECPPLPHPFKHYEIVQRLRKQSIVMYKPEHCKHNMRVAYLVSSTKHDQQFLCVDCNTVGEWPGTWFALDSGDYDKMAAMSKRGDF